MDVEKELKDVERELQDRAAEAAPASKKLTPPTMVGGAAGPQVPPGVKGPVGPQVPAKLPEENKPRVAQLDPGMVLQVELLATKQKLADADERMGLWAVQDARRRKQELDREEATLMANVSHQLGVPAGSNIKLIDKAKGLCQVG